MMILPIIIAYISLLFRSTHAVEQERVLDMTIANTSVWLSATAYCPADTYMTRGYKGAAMGFDPYAIIDISQYDVQGFIGVMPDQQAIYIAFRGSTTIDDWINDLDTVLTSYPKCSGCEVHAGFYDAEQSVVDFVKSKLQELQYSHPTFQVVFTGHSLGAAIATLMILDLQDIVGSSVKTRLFNFGSPRVGNTDFAAFASNSIADRNRFTYRRDVVPHLPWHRRFTHISGEWYEDDSGIRDCNGFEDPNCAAQWYSLSVEDHYHYLGLRVSCDSVD